MLGTGFEAAGLLTAAVNNAGRLASDLWGGLRDDDSGTLKCSLNISGPPVWKVPFLRLVVSQ
jgi:hypothetical protein